MSENIDDKVKKTQLRIEKSLADLVQKIADTEDRSWNKMICILVQEALSNRRKVEKKRPHAKSPV